MVMARQTRGHKLYQHELAFIIPRLFILRSFPTGLGHERLKCAGNICIAIDVEYRIHQDYVLGLKVGANTRSPMKSTKMRGNELHSASWSW
jgi:hypothetical protein